MSVEPNQVTLSITAPLPLESAGPVSKALFNHMRELAIDCALAGWDVSVSLTLTKPEEDSDD